MLLATDVNYGVASSNPETGIMRIRAFPPQTIASFNFKGEHFEWVISPQRQVPRFPRGWLRKFGSPE